MENNIRGPFTLIMRSGNKVEEEIYVTPHRDDKYQVEMMIRVEPSELLKRTNRARLPLDSQLRPEPSFHDSERVT